MAIQKPGIPTVIQSSGADSQTQELRPAVTSMASTVDSDNAVPTQSERELDTIAHRIERQELVVRIREQVQKFVPPGSRIAVISDGDDELVRYATVEGWHFPQAADGAYAGYSPASSHDALEHLKSMIAKGATHLLLPPESFWWLEFYSSFEHYLQRNATLMAIDPDTCVLLSLEPPEEVKDPSTETAHSIWSILAHMQEAAEATALTSEKRCRKYGVEAYGTGEFIEAENWFARAVELPNSHARNWLWLSIVQSTLGNVAAARASAQQALIRNPELIAAEWQLVSLAQSEGDTTACLQLVRSLIDRYPNDLETLHRAARIQLDLSATGEVVDTVARLLLVSPDDDEVPFLLAAAYAPIVDPDDCLTTIQSRIALSDSLLKRVPVALYLESNRPSLAWNLVRSSIDDSLDNHFLSYAGDFLMWWGELKFACEVYAWALMKNPGDNATARKLESLAAEHQVLLGLWSPPVLAYQPIVPVAGRVLHIVSHSLPQDSTGYSVRTHYICLSQREMGLDPHVVTQLGFPWSLSSKGGKTVEQVDGIDYHRIGTGEEIPLLFDARLSRNIEEAARLVEQLKPAVLQASSDYRNALIALELGRVFDLPVIYSVRGFWEETRLVGQGPGAEKSDSYSLHQKRELECMLRADAVVTLAEVMKVQLIERGVPAEKIMVVPNAVDANTFKVVERDIELASSLRIQADEVVLGYISSFNPYEGIRYIIDAIAILRSQGHRVRGLLVGDGQERKRLEQHAANLGVADAVTFTGRVPHADVLKYYSLIDIFVVPRTAARVSQLVTPLKPYEAMAAGRLVVVSRVQALCEMVIDGTTGLTFHPEDAADLAAVVGPYLYFPELRQQFGKAAREWVCANRSWKHNGQKYRALYDKLAGKYVTEDQ
jgi:PEP-CTERM/exosortase A-associated glycosyltransferase